jgi:NADH-quinone oxidoreductase subunit L
MTFLNWIWLIPLFPLFGAAAMLLVGRKLDPQAAGGHAAHHGSSFGKTIISILCPGMVLASFLLSAAAVFELAGTTSRTHQVILHTWVAGLPFHLANGAMATFGADWGFLLDPLSSVMILVVTGVGFLIHIYSVGYMAHDGGYYRFFGYMNLFVFFMLMLVMANNYLLLFVGWEGVGLCSYLLIGFYIHKKSAGDAANKAFIVNRIGDAGFILGMLLMFSMFGTVRFLDVNQALARLAPEVGFGVLSLMALMLFIGATGKSAQFPLFVWLPDAMEGPTPVSALIHAATMVTAGVYMVARSSTLFRLTPDTSLIVGIVGAFTAILAASIALVQNDIKRVLAYSTVSQLGYMFMACGAGAYWVAIFHLYTHAFFKALLFLGSGSVIHALSGEQDMRKMGGLKDKIPVTHWTMFTGSLAIAGIPGLAGFFSKDEILWQTYSSPLGHPALYAVGLITAGMTAFYMWRMMYMTFYGESRVEPEAAARIHDSPRSMTLPLSVLAAGSVIAGWIGLPRIWAVFPEGFRAFEHWLEPLVSVIASHEGEAHGAAGVEWMLMFISVGVSLGGIWLARHLYWHRRELPGRIAEASGPLYTALIHKWYFDEIYHSVFVKGLAWRGGSALGLFDSGVVDGGINGAGWLTRLSSRISIWWDTWIVDGSVRLLSLCVKLASLPARMLQNGLVQSYALVFMIGVLAFFGYFLAR